MIKRNIDQYQSKMPQCEQSDCALKGQCKRFVKKADTVPLRSGRFPIAKIGDMISSNATPKDCGFFIGKEK